MSVSAFLITYVFVESSADTTIFFSVSDGIIMVSSP